MCQWPPVTLFGFLPTFVGRIFQPVIRTLTCTLLPDSSCTDRSVIERAVARLVVAPARTAATAATSATSTIRVDLFTCDLLEEFGAGCTRTTPAWFRVRVDSHRILTWPGRASRYCPF